MVAIGTDQDSRIPRQQDCERDLPPSIKENTMNVLEKVGAGAMLLLTSFSALGDIDCARPIAGVFTGNTGQACTIYVAFKDGFSAACMTYADPGNDQPILNRTLGVLLAGYLAGKTVTIRYSGGVDGSQPSCTPSTWQRITGVMAQ
jgi:hypothetical protein